MSRRTKIILVGFLTVLAGFIILKWFLVLGFGLMAGSWFIFEHIWLPETQTPWGHIIKRVSVFAVIGILTDIFLRI